MYLSEWVYLQTFTRVGLTFTTSEIKSDCQNHNQLYLLRPDTTPLLGVWVDDVVSRNVEWGQGQTTPSPSTEGSHIISVTRMTELVHPRSDDRLHVSENIGPILYRRRVWVTGPRPVYRSAILPPIYNIWNTRVPPFLPYLKVLLYRNTDGVME